MSKRIEENDMFMNELTKMVVDKQSGTYEEMVLFHLSTIAAMLGDISKSLAVIADKAEKDEAKDLANLRALH